MKKQRIMSLLLALAMVFSLLPANAMAVDVKNFDDVSKDDWFYKYVDFVADKEYFVGTSKTTFSPEMPMTRAMFVVVLAALEGVKVDNNVSPFADVPANTWYSGAVDWAAKKGVVAGIGNNKFAPETAISREQMAVMMDAYVEWHSQQSGEEHKEKSKVENFKDADKISSWAEKSVEKCRNWGLIAGMPDGNFWPLNTASRAEVATVIYNLAWLLGGAGGGGGGGGGGAHITHSYGAWTQTKAPTCTDKGEETRYCAYVGCTAKETRDIAALGHDFATVYSTDADNHWFDCSRCDVVDAKGAHVYGAWVTTVEPTADAKGEKHRDCTVCGYCQTEEIPALGGGEGPVVPDPEEPVDYIYNAVSAVVADVKGDIEDKIGANLPTGGDAYWKDAHVKVTGVKLGTADDKRAVEVVATADIGVEAIESIVKFSAVNAVKMAGGLAVLAANVDKNDAAAVKAEIVKLINKTVDVLENKMDTDITLSKESVAAIAEYVYAACKSNASDAYNYGVNYVYGLNKHFVEDDGYVTGDVTISVGGYNVVIDVEKNSADLVEFANAHKVIDIAASVALTVADKLQNADIDAEAFIEKVLIAVENKLGKDIPEQAVIALAKDVYNYCLGKAPAAYEDAKTLYNLADVHVDKAAAAAYIAAGMVKELYASLKSYNTYTDLNDIVLATTVKVNFSGEYSEGVATAYKADTDQFPYVYPVTFKMQMDNLNSDTSIGDNFQYKYENGHCVNIVVTEKAKAAYEKMFTTAKDKVLALDVVQKMTSDLMQKAGLNQAVVAEKAYAAAGSTLAGALVMLGMDADEANAYVKAQLQAWAAENVPADITKSPLIDLFVTGTSTGNGALYAVVDKVAEQTVAYTKPYNMLIYMAARDNDFETFVEALATIVPDVNDMYEALEKAGMSGLETYLFAYLYDAVRVVNGELDEECVVDTYVCDEAAVAAMHALIDSKLVEVAKDAVAAKASAEQLKALKALEKLTALTSIDSFKNAELGALAPALENKYVQKVVSKLEDNVVERFTALLRFIPDSAAVVLPNGAVVNETALADVRDAATFGEAYEAVVEMLKEFGDLSLSDFASTKKITMKFGGRQATIGLQVEIAE